MVAVGTARKRRGAVFCRKSCVTERHERSARRARSCRGAWSKGPLGTVSGGCLGPAAVAEQGAGEVGEGLEVFGFAVVAAYEAAVVEQPGQAGFDDPAVPSEPLVGLDARRLLAELDPWPPGEGGHGDRRMWSADPDQPGGSSA